MRIDSLRANHEPMTPLTGLGRSAAHYPDKTAIIYGERRWTYTEFAAEVQHFAAALEARGVEPGNTVSVIAPNTPEMLMAHFAIPLIGAVINPLNPRLTSREFAYILDHAETKVVLVDSEVAEELADVLTGLPATPDIVEVPDAEFGTDATGTFTTYQDFLAEVPAPTPENFIPWRVDDEYRSIALNYTSGTTGPPKGVVYSHRSADVTAGSTIFHYGYTPDTVYLWTLPLFHCNGWTTGWGVTRAGGTHICLRAVRQDAIWDAFDNLGVTNLSGAPIVCATIVESERARVLDNPIQLTTAGAPPPPSVFKALEKININAVHTYGPFTICLPKPEWAELTPDERAEMMSRQGVPMDNAGDVAIVDPEMNILPADGESMGEVVLRGERVMLEYFKNPDATEASFRGGWYHSGDLGVMYPDGYIKLTDRLKDIIISGGENISSIEVEGVLHAHDAVTDVAVVGVEDEKWGERPVAYVVLDGALDPSLDVTDNDAVHAALKAHCRESLAGFKVPDKFYVVDELPRTATGKIQKNRLRKLVD